MIIYKVTNKINGKCYIGQALDFLKRKRCHISYSKKEKPTLYFHRAVKKHGFDNFEWEILENCNSKNELDEMEFHYIKQYNSYISENGYNMTWGGDDNPMNYAKYRKKVSEALKGKKRKPFSKEHKRKIGETMMGKNNHFFGKKHTKKTRKKMSEKHADISGEKNPMFGKFGKDNPNYGRRLSEETKMKISKTLLKRNMKK